MQEGIPEAIPTEACYLGWQESLAQLDERGVVRIGAEVGAGTGDLGRPAMLLPPGDDAAEDGEERQPRDPEPVGPLAHRPGLVDERLADVEDDGLDAPRRSRHPRPEADAPSPTSVATASMASPRTSTIRSSSGSVTTNGGPRRIESPSVPSARPVPE